MLLAYDTFSFHANLVVGFSGVLKPWRDIDEDVELA
jgi:hypothetical protein